MTLLTRIFLSLDPIWVRCGWSSRNGTAHRQLVVHTALTPLRPLASTLSGRRTNTSKPQLESVPKKLGTMVVGPRFELFVCDKDEIRRYDGNTGEFISVYARYDGMDCTFLHFNQLDQPDCYGASCPVQTCNQCGNLNTIIKQAQLEIMM